MASPKKTDHSQGLEGFYITTLTPETAEQAKSVIVSGLQEYFTDFDLMRNPDLVDLTTSYGPDSVFLVGVVNDQVICTGALIKETQDTVRIVRMSVAREFRRMGLASLILDRLETSARDLGMQKIVLETNSDWERAISLYRSAGYEAYDEDAESIHFAKLVSDNP